MTNTSRNALAIESQTHDAGWDYDIASRTTSAAFRVSSGENVTRSVDGSCDYEHATGKSAIVSTVTEPMPPNPLASQLIADGSWDYDSPSAVVVLANSQDGAIFPRWRSETTVVPSTSSRDSLPTMWY